jgi:hypothetical protein
VAGEMNQQYGKNGRTKNSECGVAKVFQACGLYLVRKGAMMLE